MNFAAVWSLVYIVMPLFIAAVGTEMAREDSCFVIRAGR